MAFIALFVNNMLVRYCNQTHMQNSSNMLPVVSVSVNLKSKRHLKLASNGWLRTCL